MLRASFIALALVAHSHAAEPERAPRKLALVVGIDKFDHDFSDLRYAEADAAGVAKLLKAGGFEVATLTGSGDGPNKATRANVLSRLQAMLDGPGGKLKRGDTILIFYSGHGLSMQVDKRAEAFLIPSDGKNSKPDTLLGLDATIAEVAPYGANALFLVDAARDAIDPNKGVADKSGLGSSTAVLFGCRPSERSFESEAVKHGLFSKAVIDGLSGKAAGADGVVTWSRLVAHVEDSLASEPFRKLVPKGQSQTPQLVTGPMSRVELLAAPAKDANR